MSKKKQKVIKPLSKSDKRRRFKMFFVILLSVVVLSLSIGYGVKRVGGIKGLKKIFYSLSKTLSRKSVKKKTKRSTKKDKKQRAVREKVTKKVKSKKNLTKKIRKKHWGPAKKIHTKLHNLKGKSRVVIITDAKPGKKIEIEIMTTNKLVIGSPNFFLKTFVRKRKQGETSLLLDRLRLPRGNLLMKLRVDKIERQMAFFMGKKTGFSADLKSFLKKKSYHIYKEKSELLSLIKEYQILILDKRQKKKSVSVLKRKRRLLQKKVSFRLVGRRKYNLYFLKFWESIDKGKSLLKDSSEDDFKVVEKIYKSLYGRANLLPIGSRLNL